MRRSRKKRSQLSVSLFPFLAVLICTFGVLIVMLVMAVKSADVQAKKGQADDDQKMQTKIDELQNAVDIRSVQIDGLSMSRPEVVSRLNDSRSNRSYLEDEIRKLRQEFKRVGEELVELSQNPVEGPAWVGEFSQSDANEKIEKLEQQIAATKSNLKIKREAAEQIGEAKYVIVPHKGGGGTFRRPIYFECTRSGITLQPSGIHLETHEFVPPLEAGNMLDSALLTIREYWQRYDLAGDHGSPYPLIVVRPDGAETFVLARRAMKSWDDEFGYELVESDKRLDFGTNDPQLELEIKDAIEDARNRQRSRLARMAQRENLAARFSAPVARPGLTASNAMGGFVASPGGSTGMEKSFERHRNRDVAFVGNGTSLDHFRESDNRFVENGSLFEEFKDRGDSVSGHTSKSEFQPGQSHQVRAKQNTAAMHSPAAAQNGAGQAGDSQIGNPYSDQSIAKQRGKNWALPTQTPDATGYLRPIRIVCNPNYLDVIENSGASKRIALMQETLQSIDPLVEEIWNRIESWGISGANSYWKPQLRFTIQEGGQQRFAELKNLLNQSGLVIEELRR